MKTNMDTIQELLDYIEDHLQADVSLDTLAKQFCYSKYHLSKLFTNIVGISIHTYIQRRRLSEAAKLLIQSDLSIMELALCFGYETQQSFTKAFKEAYKCTPHAYRKRNSYQPIQVPYHIKKREIETQCMIKVSVEDREEMTLVGYRKNTGFGFFVIGICWHKLHAHKHKILNRKEPHALLGLNDYTNWNLFGEHQSAFDYVAGAEVTKVDVLPKGMEAITLPASRYLVVHLHAYSQDSLQSISEYMYQTYLPQTTYLLNEHARYDFAIYNEAIDEEGKSDITYWIPIRL